MFSGLRQGALFYVLEKNIEKPILKIGQVVNVSNPTPKFGAAMSPAFAQGIDTTVDISVKFGDDTAEYKQLPSSLSIANFGNNGIVVSESREAMLTEVEAMQRTSKQILESMDYHTAVMSACDDMLKELNPQFAKEKEQEEKIGALESQMSRVENSLSAITDMLSKALKTSNK